MSIWESPNPPAKSPGLVEKERREKLVKKYPFWGWGAHEGLRCIYNNNTGCNTYYDKYGRLMDRNP
jgi:hypothetical protein